MTPSCKNCKWYEKVNYQYCCTHEVNTTKLDNPYGPLGADYLYRLVEYARDKGRCGLEGNYYERKAGLLPMLKELLERF